MLLAAELHLRLQCIILLLSSLCTSHAISTEHPVRHSECLQYLKESTLVVLTGLISYQPSPGIGKLSWSKKYKAAYTLIARQYPDTPAKSSSRLSAICNHDSFISNCKAVKL